MFNDLSVNKLRYLLLSMLMCLSLCFTSNASVINEIVVDDANLFTESEIQTLESKVSDLELEHDIDIVILTTYDSPISYSTDNKARSYIEDYVDARTQDGDNVIGICVDMGERSYALDLTGNKMFAYFPDNKQIKIEDAFVPYLSDGDYYSAAYVFLSYVDSIMDGNPTSTNYGVNGPKNNGALIGVGGVFFGIIGGFVITLFMTLSKLNQHKEKAVKKEASFYANPNDLVLTENRDTFTRKYTTKTRRQSSSSSGGGGGRTSTHRSSSGRSHSGRSGRF